MHKTILYLSCALIFLSCKQQSKNTEPISKSTELLEASKEIIRDTSTVDLVVEKDEMKNTTPISFIKHEKNGLALKATYDVYDNKLNSIGKLTINAITPIKIVRKSLKKLPQFPEQEYCEWSNFIELVYNNDTIIVFGSSILEIVYNEARVLTDKTKINLILADNFTMEAGDENGILGCDDFSYILIKPNQKGYSFIKDIDPKNKLNFGVLAHNEMMSEEISDIVVNQDTLILKIEINYQEGKGEYKMNIFKDNDWFYTITDRKND